MKSFSKWTVEEVEEEFQLTLTPNYKELQAWLGGATLPTHETETFLWNEKFR